MITFRSGNPNGEASVVDAPAGYLMMRFYDGALGALGYGAGAEMGDRVIYSADTGILMVIKPVDGNPATFGSGATIGLSAPNPEAVDAFHERGAAAGGRDEGGPGPRAALPNSYAACLRDPDGKQACRLLCEGELRRRRGWRQPVPRRLSALSSMALSSFALAANNMTSIGGWLRVVA